MRITRREILKAIRTENLKGGTWIGARVNKDGDTVSDEKCTVCAVGGVLRAKGIACDLIDDVACDITRGFYGVAPTTDDDGEEENSEFDALKQKAYMNALSIRFERLYDKYGSGKKTREKLCRFVKRHFPKTIRVEA